jgi:hypothetical protein
VRHAYATGLTRPAQGEAHVYAILAGADVARIRADLSAGMSQRKLAKRHGVSPSTIQGIHAGDSWKSVLAS